MSWEDSEEPVAIGMAAITLLVFVLFGADSGTITWLALSTAHKLIWDVPVLRDFVSLTTVDNLATLLYTRQVYVNVEIATIGLIRRCTVMPPEFIKSMTQLYLIAGVAISTNLTLKGSSPVYDIHDAAGVLLVALWFYQATKQKS